MAEVPKLLGGRYEVGELLGRGGMAEVHRGYDSRLGRQVAIKMLRSELARDNTFLVRFRREAQSAAGLNHASIVAVYDHGEDVLTETGGAQVKVPYIVMEFVDGKTLRQEITERGTVGATESLRITEGVLDALGYSHRNGIVHRDIKPANVMIAPDGSIKVMDFGIARAMADANATMTQTQAVIGTAQYLSPEQAQGQSVDERSDLYSTGCMLFELLTARPPFLGESPVSIAYQHVGEQPIPPSRFVEGISDDLDAVVLHSLAKPRDARYQSAAEFRADLQAVRLGRPISDAARGSAAALAGAAALAAASEAGPYHGADQTQAYAVAPLPGGPRRLGHRDLPRPDWSPRSRSAAPPGGSSSRSSRSPPSRPSPTACRPTSTTRRPRRSRFHASSATRSRRPPPSWRRPSWWPTPCASPATPCRRTPSSARTPRTAPRSARTARCASSSPPARRR